MVLGRAARAAASLSWYVTWKIGGYGFRVALRESAETRAAAAGVVSSFFAQQLRPGPPVSRASPPKAMWGRQTPQQLSSRVPSPVLATRCRRYC